MVSFSNKSHKVLNYTKKLKLQDMSTETNNDSFRTNILAEIKRMKGELNELKIIKKNIVKKSTTKKTARKAVKKKTARKTNKRR